MCVVGNPIKYVDPTGHIFIEGASNTGRYGSLSVVHDTNDSDNTTTTSDLNSEKPKEKEDTSGDRDEANNDSGGIDSDVGKIDVLGKKDKRKRSSGRKGKGKKSGARGGDSEAAGKSVTFNQTDTLYSKSIEAGYANWEDAVNNGVFIGNDKNILSNDAIKSYYNQSGGWSKSSNLTGTTLLSRSISESIKYHETYSSFTINVPDKQMWGLGVYGSVNSVAGAGTDMTYTYIVAGRNKGTSFTVQPSIGLNKGASGGAILTCGDTNHVVTSFDGGVFFINVNMSLYSRGASIAIGVQTPGIGFSVGGPGKTW